MLSFRLTIPKTDLKPGDWNRAVKRFQKEAGERVVEAVQSVLGLDSIYALNQPYAQAKEAGKTKPRMKHYPGKDFGQPLILTGNLYEGVTSHMEGDTLVVCVDPSHGLDPKGYDYAEELEERTQYLERGFAIVEPDLPDLLLFIIFEEMGL